MLRKVLQTSGNESVYEADAVWTSAQAIRCYGKLIATKLKTADGTLQWCSKDLNWDIVSPRKLANEYEVLPLER